MKKRIFAVLLATTLVLSLSACGGKSDSGKNKEKSEKSKKVEYVPEDEIDKAFSNPKKYKGKYVKISGQIFNGPDKDEEWVAYQAWRDPQNADKDFIFGIEGDSSFAINDYVTIDGMISGSYEGENMMGGEITCPIIRAKSVEKISYIDAVVPTIKEIVPENMVSEQNGISLKVDKIEFAEKETRVYLTETNNSADKFSMYTYSIKITQSGKQIEQDTSSSSSYNGGYEELSSEILPSASSSGILVFPAMDSSVGFQIYAEGSSDNYEIDFAPFTFDIAVQ